MSDQDKSEQKSFLGCPMILDPDMPSDEVRMVDPRTKSTIRVVNLEKNPCSTENMASQDSQKECSGGK